MINDPFVLISIYWTVQSVVILEHLQTSNLIGLLIYSDITFISEVGILGYLGLGHMELLKNGWMVIAFLHQEDL